MSLSQTFFLIPSIQGLDRRRVVEWALESFSSRLSRINSSTSGGGTSQSHLKQGELEMYLSEFFKNRAYFDPPLKRLAKDIK